MVYLIYVRHDKGVDMDKEVKLCKEELELAHKCVILLFFGEQTKMAVFFDDGRAVKDIVLSSREDSKYAMMINMRKFFKQGH